MFTPYSYPWFIIPVGIILLFTSLKFIKNQKEYLYEKDLYYVSIFSTFYIIFNSIFIISNFYFGGFPWSLLILNTSTFLLLLKKNFKNIWKKYKI